jgi:hypothetical protein
MSETYLMTIEAVVQVGSDSLIIPTLSSDEYYLADVNKVKIVKPDNQVIEMDAEFSIPFTTPERRNIYLGLIPYTQIDKVPVGSQIWVYKTLEEITCHP